MTLIWCPRETLLSLVIACSFHGAFLTLSPVERAEPTNTIISQIYIFFSSAATDWSAQNLKMAAFSSLQL